MPRKVRDLRSELRRAGFVLMPRRGKGRHELWRHPTGITAGLVGRDGTDAQHYQEAEVARAIRAAREATARQGQGQ